jgi:predicted DNA-binding transcriptional regulator AlpA
MAETLSKPRRLIYRTPGAAQYLGLSASTLEKMRLQGTGPRFTKLGTRAVGYREEDLDEFALIGRRRSTSDTGYPSGGSQALEPQAHRRRGDRP